LPEAEIASPEWKKREFGGKRSMKINNLIDKDFRGIVYVVQNNTVICQKQNGFA